ncbi:MAG: DNA repair protein RadC, partial [Muribaculaceae bacterium]|nr:DNA repair protein RadC [Muribaculaceae bacterium]
EMLAHCKNKLQKLARLSIDDLTKNFEGVGPAKAISLIAAFELGLRHNDEEIADDPVITSSENVFHIMRSRLGRISHEEFWVLMLSRNNRVIYEQRISIGGTSSTMADAKIIYKSAIDKMAEAIILVHNHPSGNINPSPEDDRLTAKIKEAGKVLDIQVLDHVIITQNKYFSYADNGRL